MYKYFEVKYFQPAKSKGIERSKLNGAFDHPDRYRFSNCVQEVNKHRSDSIVWLRMLGSQDVFPFENGVCEKFLEYYRAEIVGEIDSNRRIESDRFLPFV